MSGPRPPYQGDNTPLNPTDVEQQAGDQVAYLRQDELASSDDEFNDTAEYEGYPEIARSSGTSSNLEDLTDLELRSGETDDPNIAAEEGLAYVPPTDPPVIPSPDDPQGIEIASGFGSTAEDEPYDSSHESELVSNEDDFIERVREALRADATTSGYADSLALAHRSGVVGVRGVVDDLDDTDNIIDVISRVSGVTDVRDELEVPGLTD